MTDIIDYFSSLNLAQAIGVAGFFVYLLVFGAVQFEFMDGNGSAYTLGNIIAASLVGVSLTVDFNLASALIQGSWILIGLGGLIHRFLKAPGTSTQLNL